MTRAVCPACGAELEESASPYGGLLFSARKWAHCQACGRFWSRRELAGSDPRPQPEQQPLALDDPMTQTQGNRVLRRKNLPD